MSDRISKLLDQWGAQRPELDASGLAVVARVQDLAKMLRRNENGALRSLGLNMFEYDVLSALRRQGSPYRLSATELARETLLSTGAMTNRIDRLEERGLVSRAHDAADRRVVKVSLTADGVRLVDAAVEARLQAAETHLSNLSRPERDALSQGLSKLLLSGN